MAELSIDMIFLSQVHAGVEVLIEAEVTWCRSTCPKL